MLKTKSLNKFKGTQNVVPVIKASDDAHIKEFSLTYQQEIIPLAVETAKDHASANVPSAETTSFLFSDFLTTRFNRAVIDYKSSSQNSQQQFHMNEEVSTFKRHRNRLKDKLQKTVNDLRIKERAVMNLKSHRESVMIYKRLGPGVIVLCGAEGLFSATSLQLIMPNMAIALIVGAFFSVALYFSAHIGCKLLRKTNTRMQFIGVLALILFVIGSVFSILGHFRIEYLKQMEVSAGSYQLSALEFCGIQLFFYCVALFIKVNYLPSKAILEKYQLWKNANKDLSRLAKVKKSLDDSLENLEQQLSTNLITRRTLLTSSKDVELKLVAMYKDAFQHYVKTNLHYRSDGAIPKCFQDADKLPELTLYYQDDELLNYNATGLHHED